jgi:Fe-S oxidoreductase
MPEGKPFAPLPEADVCCGGAGAFSFAHPELSDEVLRRKIGCIASTQARLVVTSSTSCLIQLAHGLKKYYPDCKVLHISEFVASHGKKTGA